MTGTNILKIAFMQVQFIRETRNKFHILTVCIMLMLFFPRAGLVAQDKTVTYYADPSSVPPDLPVTIHHLTAHVSFKPGQNLVTGDADFTITPNRSRVDTIVFQAPDFSISSVTLNGREVRHQLSGAKLLIFPGPGALKPKAGATSLISHIGITYSATPLAGSIYFIGWRPEEAGKRKEIWAHRPNGWLPYMEGRITVDMYVTFDRHFRVFSNGERIDVKDNTDGTRTWHYSMKKNHPFFSTSLVIGDYSYQSSRTARGVPLEFWYYSDMADRVATTYKYTAKMFDFYEKEIGVNYPYPVYREAPVIDYMYGAMETTTSTVFGDYMLIDPRAWWQRNYVNVNAHELAHQWFGNYIAHFVNRDVWLTESFATYYAKLFEKSIYGYEYYQNLRNDEMNMVFDAAKKNSFPVGSSKGGTQRIYQKGSLVLEMLRDVMGDEEFRRAITIYLKKFGLNYAETNDFMRCCYEASGQPLNWFFDEWILRGGEPVYRVSDSVTTGPAGNQSTVFRVTQEQETSELNALFAMPVVFKVVYTDGTSDSRKVWIEKKSSEVEIPNPQNKQVDFLLFDPGRRILKKVTFDRTPVRLLSQALKATDMIDRYDAWLELRVIPASGKMESLITSFHREPFWLIKGEILEQLSTDHSPEVVEIFREALCDKDANVRKMALRNLVPVPDLLQGTVEELLTDSSYLNVELALGSLCTSFPRDADHYLDLTKGMEGWRGKNIRMKWLEMAISKGKLEFLPELVEYTGPKYEFETRMNAFSLLKKFRNTDPVALKNAGDASRHWNIKLSTVATEYLNEVRPGR